MNESRVFIHALTQAGTTIGSHFINPGEPPKGLTDQEFEEVQREAEHYEGQRIIAIYRPGDNSYENVVEAATLHMRELQERQAADRAGRFVPPEPRNINIAVAPTDDMRRRLAQEPALASEGEEKGPARQCVAVTATAGKLCKAIPAEGKQICGNHIRQIKEGKAVYNIAKVKLTEDDIEI
jgi:hypothetical protein